MNAVCLNLGLHILITNGFVLQFENFSISCFYLTSIPVIHMSPWLKEPKQSFFRGADVLHSHMD